MEAPEQYIGQGYVVERVIKTHLSAAEELPPDTLFVMLETATSLYALPWFNRN